MRPRTAAASFLMAVSSCVPSTCRAAEPPRYALAVHGGAGWEPEKMSAEERRAVEQSLARALGLGRDILARGGASLDAVELVVRSLEDDPLFNAGRGAVFNSVGGHELDASIMDGRAKACGAVAGVRTVANPVSLARMVMEKTRHVLLAGEGAERFAREMGVPAVDQKYFDTESRRKDWLEAVEQERKKAAHPAPHKGTVGCVALDTHGDLAAATSTGGLTNKKFGRVGDSPIVGAGTYADNATVAVSCTGTGEEFIRHAAAYDVAARVKYKGQALGEAVADVIHHTLKADDGGMIAVGKDGALAADYSTAGMARGLADSSGRFEVAIGSSPLNRP